jgi:hypothetical protein
VVVGAAILDVWLSGRCDTRDDDMAGPDPSVCGDGTLTGENLVSETGETGTPARRGTTPGGAMGRHRFEDNDNEGKWGGPDLPERREAERRRSGSQRPSEDIEGTTAGADSGSEQPPPR